MLFSLLVLFAQAPEKGGGGEGQPMGMMFVLLAIFAAFYFIIILPQQRKDRKQRELLFNTLKKNDEVITSSGIIGIVQTIKDGDEVVLKIDENAKIRVLKSSIVRIIPKDAPAPTTAPTT